MARPLKASRRVAVLVLCLGVTALHLRVADRVLENAGDGAAGAPAMRRMEVAFVRALAPVQPPAAPVAARPATATRRAAVAVPTAPASAASAATPPVVAVAPEAAVPDIMADAPGAAVPDAVASAPSEAPLAQAPIAAASSPEEASSAPDSRLAALPAASAASAASAAGAAASGAMAGAVAGSASESTFEWPPSTRLSFIMTGQALGGPVDGHAEVQWLHAGGRYQVHLDVVIGPPFLPLARRSLSSEGRVGPQGLEPLRYQEETRTGLRDPRRAQIVFEESVVRMPDGRQLPKPQAVQDTASQFVQLTWLFTTQPQRLVPGGHVDVELALPRRVERWTYDVLAKETLYTPFGSIEAVHVKPRREARKGGDLTAESWIAPSLQYLPVRIVIRQDAETWLDLTLRELPKQAAPPPVR